MVEEISTHRIWVLSALAVGIPFLIWGYAEVVYFYFLSPVSMALAFVFVAAYASFDIWLIGLWGAKEAEEQRSDTR